MKICKNCIYFMPPEDDREFGMCRRYAPKPLICSEAVLPAFSSHLSHVKWPDVHADYWCGEFEKGRHLREYPKWSEMCWTTRVFNILEEHGINSVQQLVTKTKKDILSMKGFGCGSLFNIRFELGRYDLGLSGDRENEAFLEIFEGGENNAG